MVKLRNTVLSKRVHARTHKHGCTRPFRRVQQIAHWHSQTNLFPGDVAPDKSLHPTCLHTLCARYFLQRRLIRFEFHHSFLLASGSIAMVNFVLFYLVSRLAVSVSSALQARLVLQSTVTIIETKIHIVYAANQCLPKAEIRKKKEANNNSLSYYTKTLLYSWNMTGNNNISLFKVTLFGGKFFDHCIGSFLSCNRICAINWKLCR